MVGLQYLFLRISESKVGKVAVHSGRRLECGQKEKHQRQGLLQGMPWPLLCPQDCVLVNIQKTH